MQRGGVFIVLEGVEGVGKTTQWTRLRDRIAGSGQTVVAVREPGGPNVGEFIRRLVLSAEHSIPPATEALLFAASRAEVVADVIRPALARGDVVLVDRFLLSTYAYQGGGRGIDDEQLRSINAFATGGLVPDATLLLTLPVDAALERASRRSKPDRIELENRAFHHRVASTFHEALTPRWQHTHPDCGYIEEVDASGSADDVTSRCLGVLAQQWPLQFGVLLDDNVVQPASGPLA